MSNDQQAHIADLAERKLAGMFRWSRRRELKKLPYLLSDGESVVTLAQGNRSPWWYGASYWLVVLTNRRIILLRYTGIHETLQDFAFDRINSVEANSDAMGAKLTIVTTDRKVVVDSISPKGDAAQIADYVRERISHDPEAAEPAEHIRRLAELRDAGILTQEEFEAKKADLLARM